MGNTFGNIIKLTTFGESHGVAIGGILEGIPAGFELNLEKIQQEMDRRKPGQSNITTQRKESDTVQFLSGIFEGKTLGTPIGFTIKNEDNKSKDYSHLKDNFRPSHADFTTQEKYGIRDYRGGGRASARETACRVVGGAIAKQFLEKEGIIINAFVSSVGTISVEKPWQELNFDNTEKNKVRCPDLSKAQEMEDYILEIKKQGDTVGGIITGVIQNLPTGLGEPVFDKLHSQLGKAMLSINAVKGFEYGSGFSGASLRGSKHNDIFENKEGIITTKTNNSGGIQGGISNGEAVNFKVAFKPVATIMQKQESVNEQGEKIELDFKGRHDPCVVPRAVPIVEAMASLTILDFFMRNKISAV
ncbi:chorismate synthase [Flavobacteriales bacterium]|nr:chorismate synthase [Flavobacteriales bacterium]